MIRQLLAVGLLVWVGSALLLSRRPRFSRLSLSDRLRPFHPGAGHVDVGRESSVRLLRQGVGSVVEPVGDRLARLFGVAEHAALRLSRIHSRRTPQAFRLRQLGWSAAALVVGAAVATVARLPAAASLLFVVGAPLLTFLLAEQKLARESDAWQERTAQELPVIAEQLAMLLNAGYSLGASLGRIAERGHGCVARDLEVAVNRIRQGLSEADALQEWADRAGIDAVRRLVAVLTLHSDTADLGRLITTEARQIRRDLHRRTLEHIERRAQAVWVPVTVATLVPGAILLAVPFLAALKLFSNA